MRIRSRIVLVPLLLAACGGGQSMPSSAPAGESALVAPGLVVDRFLRAVNTNDLETMGRLFGTRDGSIFRRDDRADVEQRMFALASLLRHNDYSIAGEGVVPGRTADAIRLMVRMQFGEETATVPFVMVRSREGWLVEHIGMSEIIAR